MKELLNMDADHKKATLITQIIVIGCMLTALVAVSLSFKLSAEHDDRLYVVNRSVALEALSSDVQQNRPAEAKFTLNRFHELFYNIAPDPQSIASNMRKTTYISDESTRMLYDNLREQKFYENLINSNTVQTVDIDSTVVDLRTTPMRGRISFTLIQKRASAESITPILAECEFVDVNRSDNNPNGFLIKGYRILKRGETRENVINQK